MGEFILRIRFRLSEMGEINLDKNLGEFNFQNDKYLKLRYQSKSEDGNWMTLLSPGWFSKNEAENYSERIVDALRMSLARFDMSANFGNRAFKSRLYDAGLKMMEDVTNRPVLNDEHGISIFPSNLNPSFASASTPKIMRSVNAEQWGKIFQPALNSGYKFSERERTAFDMYTTAHDVRQSPDAAFALLFTAFETLLEKDDRPDVVQNHVDKLIVQTSNAKLPKNEINSLLGSLKWLKSYSIRQSGMSLVQNKLGDKKYGKMTAIDLFEQCYTLRNRLFHGNIPFPTFDEVDSIVAPFQVMIGHLLSGPVLELDFN